jgi:hypothetical protein
VATVAFLRVVRRVGVARAKAVKEAAAEVGDVLTESGITYLMASAYSSEVGSRYGGSRLDIGCCCGKKRHAKTLEVTVERRWTQGDGEGVESGAMSCSSDAFSVTTCSRGERTG